MSTTPGSTKSKYKTFQKGEGILKSQRTTEMTPEEKQERIAALEAEIAELKKPEKTAVQRFWELVSGTEVKFDFDNYPNTIFGFRGDKYVWEFDFKKNYLWLRYSTVWSVLANEYSLNYDDVQSLVNNEVEEHFKCKGVTPVSPWSMSVDMVEEHLKCKEVTPAGRGEQNCPWVEEI